MDPRSFVFDDPTPVDNTAPTILVEPSRIDALRLIEARAAGIAQGKKECKKEVSGSDFEKGMLVGWLLAVAGIVCGVLLGVYLV